MTTTREYLEYLEYQNTIISQIWSGIDTRASVFLSVCIALVAGISMDPTGSVNGTIKVLWAIVSLLPIGCACRVLSMRTIRIGLALILESDLNPTSEQKETMLWNMAKRVSRTVSTNRKRLNRKDKLMLQTYQTAIPFMIATIILGSVSVALAS